MILPVTPWLIVAYTISILYCIVIYKALIWGKKND